MSAHTPGPWAVQEVIPSDVARWGRAPEGHDTLESATADFPSFDIRGGGLDTTLFRSGDGPGGLIGLVAHVVPTTYGRVEALANAHLIAAAPRMLAALESLIASCPCDPDINVVWDAAWHEALAAIDEARNEGAAT